VRCGRGIGVGCLVFGRMFALTNGHITIEIRARFEHDTTSYEELGYVLSSNNEHVNSSALL